MLEVFDQASDFSSRSNVALIMVFRNFYISDVSIPSIILTLLRLLYVQYVLVDVSCV